MPNRNGLSGIPDNSSSQLIVRDNPQAKRIKICSALMIILVVIGAALSIFGFTPVAGGVFVLAFICALVVVVDTLNTRRHG